MQNAKVSNPKDYSVVSFHNATEFGFTPEMGCMYDGRPINGAKGSPGIDAGESIILPYHIGNQLAVNLAKRVLNTSPAATVDAQGIPTGVPIWSKERLEEEKKKFLTELYSEAKPTGMSDTDRLMAKVEEYKKLVEEKLGGLPQGVVTQKDVIATVEDKIKPQDTLGHKVFLDKQEVIAELEKRGIKHDKRSNKATLEQLLA